MHLTPPLIVLRFMVWWGMLRHAFLRVGEVIFCSILFCPTWTYCPLVLPTQEGSNKGSKSKKGRKCCKKITSPTCQNEWHIIFCQPKASLAQGQFGPNLYNILFEDCITFTDSIQAIDGSAICSSHNIEFWRQESFNKCLCPVGVVS